MQQIIEQNTGAKFNEFSKKKQERIEKQCNAIRDVLDRATPAEWMQAEKEVWLLKSDIKIIVPPDNISDFLKSLKLKLPELERFIFPIQSYSSAFVLQFTLLL